VLALAALDVVVEAAPAASGLLPETLVFHFRTRPAAQRPRTPHLYASGPDVDDSASAFSSTSTSEAPACGLNQPGWLGARVPSPLRGRTADAEDAHGLVREAASQAVAQHAAAVAALYHLRGKSGVSQRVCVQAAAGSGAP